MTSAASANRLAGLNSNAGKAKKRAAPVGAKSASAAPSSVAAKKGMHNSTAIKVAPQNASVSEKRRVAALISWEKRRNAAGKKALKAKKAAKASKKRPSESVASAIPVTPPKGKKKAVQKRSEPAAAAPPAKRPKVDAGSSGGNASTAKSITDIRRKAAKLGWERRRKQLEAESSAGSSTYDVSSGDEQSAAAAAAADDSSVVKKKATAASTKAYTAASRRQAAVLGWEKRRNEKDASDIRRKAAKLGWERRRSLLAAESAGSSASDASSGDEQSAAAVAAIDSLVVKKKATAASKKACTAAESRKVYSATARRQAAMLGWEKRRNEKAAMRNTDSSSVFDDASFAATMPSLAPSKTQPKTETKQHRQGTKRSRRLAQDPAGNEDESRKISDLVTYLRLTRGWMEFQPSSRHGSGTATSGYIPNSIATFIRSGTISQRTVLDHGTLGVHYALDWDGYGGLKDMINTFGVYYSPFPTEQMMELSRVTEWEMGEDLPWREVEEAEEKKLRAEQEKISTKEPESSAATSEDEDMKDIMFVANILASLDRRAATDSTREEVISDTRSPSILALNNYYSSSEESDSLSHLADVTVMRECEDQRKAPSKIVDEDVLIIQARKNFNHWNFGL
eukprot:CAMPEP_0172306164 /NCGR_PEP_ID=MMETSP1058-20130122/7293_1 /TAXON_ID=83371 /ORGANISM="Detonula confervacea, Strain CCMP 353" /LENGTH=624 /DNA_ID=CAMNT_0013017967 /DNA_START=114 /DNA_END=1988 /DNA_ORIENTATION=-